MDISILDLHVNLDVSNNHISSPRINCNQFLWFYNLNIPESIVEIVSLGQKFSHNLVMDKRLASETIKNTENLLNFDSFLPNDTKMNIWCNIIDEVN